MNKLANYNAGQCHISSVEEGSPAQCGGLQVSGKYFKQNYNNTSLQPIFSHQQVKHPQTPFIFQVGDRIVEVEGENVSLENHGQVVARIAGAGLSLTMLVVDQECEEFHRARNIVISSSLPHTVRERE